MVIRHSRGPVMSDYRDSTVLLNIFIYVFVTYFTLLTLSVYPFDIFLSLEAFQLSVIIFWKVILNIVSPFQHSQAILNIIYHFKIRRRRRMLKWWTIFKITSLKMIPFNWEASKDDNIEFEYGESKQVRKLKCSVTNFFKKLT